MIDKKKVLALIPARGGSKGIKDKNIIDLCGKPLISYTIEAAKTSKYIDTVVVSTDSNKIAQISSQYNAEIPFLRPTVLATDTSKTIDVVVHAIESLKGMGRKYDILILLQPTQPLRTNNDIDNALQEYIDGGELSLASVCEVRDNPILMRMINENGTLKPLLNQQSTVRRQDMQKYYKVNGCIYINKISEIKIDTSFNDNNRSFIMDIEHSVDIDTLADLELASALLNLKII